MSRAGFLFLRKGIRASLRMRQRDPIIQRHLVLSTLQRHDQDSAKFYLLVDVLHANCRATAHLVSDF